MFTELEIKALTERINELEAELNKAKVLLRNEGIDLSEYTLSPEESICVNEILKLKRLSDTGQFTKDEAQILDILYKNLRLIRGQSVPQDSLKKKQKIDTDELFKIVQGEKS
jgi:hypothetical protein